MVKLWRDTLDGGFISNFSFLISFCSVISLNMLLMIVVLYCSKLSLVGGAEVAAGLRHLFFLDFNQIAVTVRKAERDAIVLNLKKLEASKNQCLRACYSFIWSLKGMIST
jgi:hypothetical protein